MGEYGSLKEQKVQLELKLTQEEFHYEQLGNRKDRAIAGVLGNAGLMAVVLLVGFSIWRHCAFPLAGEFVAILSIIWMFITIHHEKNDIRMLLKREFDEQKTASMFRQQKLKQEIAEIDEKLSKIHVTTWTS